MNHCFTNRDILSMNDFLREEIEFLITATEDMKKSVVEKRNFTGLLQGRKLASLFYENSTRTKFSTEDAMQSLGGRVLSMDAEGSSVKKGETLYDTVKMFEGYHVDAFAIRHHLDGAAQWIADNVSVPVINCGDGKHEHPTQTLTDLFSIQETQQKIDGLHIGLCGDLKYGRTTHSLAKALALFDNVTISLITPPLAQLPDSYLEHLREQNVQYHIEEDLAQAIPALDVLYMTRMQLERIEDPTERKLLAGKYQLTAESLKEAKDHLRVLHPLPDDKSFKSLGEGLRENKHSYFYQQAQNGWFLRQALIALVLGAHKTGTYEKKEVTGALAELVPQPIHTNPDKTYRKIARIENGTVIDRITAGRALDVVGLLGIPPDATDFIGRGLGTTKTYMDGVKDIYKVENFYLTAEAVNRIAVIAPYATISIIRNGEIKSKGRVQLPEVLENVIRCNNEKCISQSQYNEGVPTKFVTKQTDPPLLSCHYCDELADSSAQII